MLIMPKTRKSYNRINYSDKEDTYKTRAMEIDILIFFKAQVPRASMSPRPSMCTCTDELTPLKLLLPIYYNKLR